MNERRLFLTKEEVRQLGVELTAETSDRIKILYLPLNRTVSSSSNGDILFSYYNLTSDTAYTNTWTSYDYKSYVGYDNTRYPIRLSGGLLTFNWYMKKSSSSSTIPSYFTIMYREMAAQYVNGPNGASTTTWMDIFLPDDNLYIGINITDIPINLYSYHSIRGEFVIKYLSGTIPADTVFYEPYSAE